MRRVQVISQQVCNGIGNEDPSEQMTIEERTKKFYENFRAYTESTENLVVNGVSPTRTLFEVEIEQRGLQTREGQSKRMLGEALDAAENAGKLKVCELLPGPLRHAATRDEKISVLGESELASKRGANMYLWAKWQQDFGDAGLSSNIAVPVFVARGFGAKIQGGLTARVVVCDPEDAERISRTHVQKDGSFEPILLDSIISTTDNEYWMLQRRHLAEVFSPMKSLAAILPVSHARAQSCAERLEVAAAAGPVDMSDFLLHEAQAQLQLALLGLPEDFMEATNADIRANFSNSPDAPVGKLSQAMAEVMRRAMEDKTLALPSDGCPVRGPLARAVQTSPDVGVGPSASYGNALLILFAGHDTTGHCMTWLLFELSRHPKFQTELQQEVDGFFNALGGREPTYADLSKMPFLDRCITETLRLWNSVPNGTFRQLQFDDDIKGESGMAVTLPKGTLVNVLTWSRHRNPDLWGADADLFNPHRRFEPEELTSVGKADAATNPQSARFSPFVHAPRSCLGRNFAQMEMRLIIPHLVRKFEFSLAPPYDKIEHAATGATISSPDEFRGNNMGTMGPVNLDSPKMPWGTIYTNSMKLHVRPRPSVQ